MSLAKTKKNTNHKEIQDILLSDWNTPRKMFLRERERKRERQAALYPVCRSLACRWGNNKHVTETYGNIQRPNIPKCTTIHPDGEKRTTKRAKPKLSGWQRSHKRQEEGEKDAQERIRGSKWRRRRDGEFLKSCCLEVLKVSNSERKWCWQVRQTVFVQCVFTVTLCYQYKVWQQQFLFERVESHQEVCRTFITF